MAIVAAIAVVAGAYVLGERGGSRDSSAPLGPPASPAQTQPTAVGASTDPTQSAVAWLQGYRSLSYTDPAPGSWVARVSPVVTPDLVAEYRGYEGGFAGPQWTSFVAQRCVSSVPAAAAVIPPEAPHGPDDLYVQVEGDVTTVCAIGDAPGGNSEHAAATLELHRDSSDHRWRVERRVF